MAIERKQVEVARKDDLVIVAVRCADHYSAMSLYDEIASSLSEGWLSLEIESIPPASTGRR